MKTPILFWFLLGAGILGMQAQGRGEVTATPPAGYVKVEIGGHSENFVTAPLRKRAVFSGRIVESGSNELSFSQPGWIPNQFAATANGEPCFYLEVVTGDWTGIYFPILENTADTVILDVAERDLTAPITGLGVLLKDTYTLVSGSSGLTPTLETLGDTVRIRPAWTIGELFGSGSNTVLDQFTNTAAADPLNGGDRLYIPDNETVGFQKAPIKSLGYISGVGWRSPADANKDESANILLPGNPAIIHRNSNANAELITVGYPKIDRSVLWVPGSTDTMNLSYVASPFSEPLSLDESGLNQGSGGAINPSPALTQRGDELFLYDGSHGGPFAVPERRFISLIDQGWRELGSNSTTIGTTDMLLPGRGFAILKKPNESGAYWISLPTYLETVP